MLFMMKLRLDVVRMLGISSHPFATVFDKADRTIQDPAAGLSVAPLVESDS
jgi:hypothetical protein